MKYDEIGNKLSRLFETMEADVVGVSIELRKGKVLINQATAGQEEKAPDKE